MAVSCNLDQRKVPSMCGLEVILFVFNRVVRKQAFQVASKLTRQRCSQSQVVFFSGEALDVQRKLETLDEAVSFGNFDVRLSTVSMGRCLRAENRLDERQQVLGWGKQRACSYQEMMVKIEALPDRDEFWPSALREIQQDPLVRRLRCKRDGKHLTPTQRKKLLLSIWEELTPEKQREQDKFVRKVLDKVYLPCLQSASAKVRLGMSSASFLGACAASLGAVSFAVHFLREVDRWTARHLVRPRNSTLTETFAQADKVVRKLSRKNVQTLSKSITTCQRLMDDADQLLQQLRTPSIPVQQIIERNEQDLVDHEFLLDGCQPWNFPVNLSCVNLRQLLASNLFKINFAIGVKIVVYAVKDLPSATVEQAVQSLSSILAMLNPKSPNFPIFCQLAHNLRQAVGSNPEWSAKLRCQVEPSQIVDDFFARVNQRYCEIFYCK
jgi:hypothetical protein